jgi:hypothetical protein
MRKNMQKIVILDLRNENEPKLEPVMIYIDISRGANAHW